MTYISHEFVVKLIVSIAISVRCLNIIYSGVQTVLFLSLIARKKKEYLTRAQITKSFHI